MEIAIAIVVVIIALRLAFRLIGWVSNKIVYKIAGRLKWRKRVRKINKSAVVTGEDYERYVANRLLSEGFLTSYYLTKTSGDYGADIVGTYKKRGAYLYSM